MENRGVGLQVNNLQENKMFRLLLLCALFSLHLTACEQQKQASAEIGAKPKQIIDKVTNDLNKAQALATDKAQKIKSEIEPSQAE